MPSPPDSPFMQMLNRAIFLVESDPGLQSYFGWTAPSGDADYDKRRRRRIFLDDNGTCPKELSPKLVMCEINQDNEFNLMGDGGNIPSDIAATIGVIVYVHVEETSDGEAEQILCGNLHSAVRQVLRKNCVDEEALWMNMMTVGPACSFDSSKGWRRAGGLIAVEARKRIT